MTLILDYSTKNARWGNSGICFKDIEEYAFILGFLSNKRHFKNKDSNSTKYEGSISIHIENNMNDGAWTKESRIHYYKTEDMLKTLSPLYRAKSKGVGNITYRINSNKYIDHLLNNYGFKIIQNGDNGYIKCIMPPDNPEIVKNILTQDKTIENLDTVKRSFENGWNL